MARFMAEPRLRRLFVLAALTVAYFAAGRLGLSLAVVNASTSAVWPPTGIAVAALLLAGMGVWPAIAAGAFLVNLTTSGVVLSSVAIAAGNTLEGVAAAALVTRFARGRAAFDHPADLFRFVLAAIVATALAASVGTASLVAAGLAPSPEAGSIWLTWWLGDALGTMLVAPLVMLWAREPRIAWPPRQALEAGGLLASVLIVSIGVFSGLPIGARQSPVEFLIMPVLLWAAFRFGARETATCAVLASAVAIVGTLQGFGPFARGSPNQSLLLLQSFIGVTTIVMLAVAAEVGRRKAIDAELRALNDALERGVDQQTEELTHAHDRLNDAQQVAHIGSWEWDVPSNTLWWSDELYRIYGIDRGAAPTYEAFLRHVHPEDRERIEAAVRQAMVDGRPFVFDHRIVRPDGAERVLYAEGRVVADAAGRPIRMMGIGHDITERRRADEAREQLNREQAARREAEEASRVKDRFLATLSHELRTPLNAALGWARLLAEVPEPNERVSRATQAIYRNLLIQTRLVSDIMDVSRAAAGTLALQRAPVDLAAVVEAAVDTVRDAASARRVRFEVTGLAPPPTISGDAQRLQQVVWNLLDNAVKFSGHDCVVHVTLRRRARAVELDVADDGPGIDPAFLPHVFEEFRQADDSVTRVHGGLGLGLAIARHIVERHGGTIVAANRHEGGAVFTISLPAESPAAAVSWTV